jgi:hypothetical protein
MNGSPSLTEDEIVNFMYVLDDKEKSPKMIEMEFLSRMRNVKTGKELKTFYINHLDLFIANESAFIEGMLDSEFDLSLYTKLKAMHFKVKDYFDALKTQSHILPNAFSPSPTRRTSTTKPINVWGSEIVSSTSSPSSWSSTLKTFLYGGYPVNSIFSKIDPVTFAEVCDRMYKLSYFNSEARYMQYYARHHKEKLQGKNVEIIKGVFNNLQKKLLYEIDLFCRTGKISLIVFILNDILLTFLKMGNIPLASFVLNSCLHQRLFICKPLLVTKILEQYNDLSKFKRYRFLDGLDKITLSFVNAMSIPDSSFGENQKLSVFNKIYAAMSKTRVQLFNDKMFKQHQDFISDITVYEYLHPERFIEGNLVGEIECIMTVCKKDVNDDDDDDSLSSLNQTAKTN